MKVYLLFSQALKEDPLVKLTFELKIKKQKAMWNRYPRRVISTSKFLEGRSAPDTFAEGWGVGATKFREQGRQCREGVRVCRGGHRAGVRARLRQTITKNFYFYSELVGRYQKFQDHLL